MYAVIRSGGRQYRVAQGDLVDVERLPHEVDQQIQITEVLLIGNGETTVIGQPMVEGVSVTATVIDQYRGKKIIVFKYRQRTNFRRKRGHRQYYTRLRVDSINV
ncbi:MAG: 50S ribosomal protein L21 [Anaerolineae bacterium]|jgi:large subunit ribosomal protein L21|nr:50S ribosomal protein L21 [Anaerolineae bacterium]